MSGRLSNSSLIDSIYSPIDFVITCASFEDRCLSVSFALPEHRIESVAIFFIEEFTDYSYKNRSKLSAHFRGKGREIPLSYNNPRSAADSIFETITSEGAKNKNILVDISTFTRESLLILIKALYDNKQHYKNCQLVYTCATHTSENLSYDLVEIRTVMGFLGEMKPTKPLHLVILAGFEYERARQVIDAYEPDYISIGYGSDTESISSDLHKLNIKFKEKLISIYTSDVVSQFPHSLIDPYRTALQLAEIVNERSECNTVIVPLNTKISTVGAGLLAIKQPEIQICYTQMAKYNVENYSQASNEFYVFNLWRDLA